MHETGLSTSDSDDERRSTPDYLNAVKRALTPAVIERITEYAGRRADMLAAAGIRGAEGRMIAQDAMGEVILRRRWDQSRTLEGHLIGLIRQRTSNRLRQARTMPHVSLDDTRDGFAVGEEVAATATGQAPDVRDAATKKANGVITWLKQRAAADAGVLALLAAYELDVNKRGEIADLAGMGPRDVTNARARLDRMLRELPDPLASSNDGLRRNQ